MRAALALALAAALSGCGHDSNQLVFRDPETCRKCHPQHVADWEGAMHAYATKDPLFIAIADIQASDFAGEAGQFCTQCHTVPGFLAGETTIYNDAQGTFRQKTTGLSPVAELGVSCDVCHSVTSVLQPRNGELLFVPDGTIHGPFGDAQPNDFHQSVASPLHKKGDLCAGCHDVFLPFNYKDVPLETTGIEWQSYIAAGGDKQCQDCHMPTRMDVAAVGGPVREVHSHTFVGVDIALIPFPDQDNRQQLVQDMLSKAVDLAVAADADMTGKPIGFTATLTNQSGHAVPSGVTSERRMWLEATLTDGGGNPLYRTGMLDADGNLMDGIPEHTTNPGGDPDLWWFGANVTNSTGPMGVHLVAFPHQSDAIATQLLAPQMSASKSFKFGALASGSYTLTVRLLFRPLQPYFFTALEKNVVSKLDPSLAAGVPTYTMATQVLPIVVP